MSSHLLPDGRIPVLISSDTPDGVAREAAAILDYLERHPAVSPERLAEQLFRTRSARRHRVLVLASGADLCEALQAVVDGEPHRCIVAGTNPAVARKVGFVFPGQGSQRPGMGRMYYDSSPVFKAAVDEVEEAFQRIFGISPLTYLLDVGGDGDGVDPVGFADDVTIVQPALFMQMIGLAAIWRAAGVEPAATIGHSQGEIAAAVVSGVISIPDAVRVVTTRANLVSSLCQEHGLEGVYSMAVVGLDREETEAVLARHSGWAELSVVNSAHVIAISGERSMVADVVATLSAQGTFAKEIRVAYPAHTSIVSKFRSELGAVVHDLDNKEFLATDVPSFGATLGTAITPDLPTGDYWFWNLRNRVRFDLATVAAAEYGVDTFVEIADHPALLLAILENLSTVGGRTDFLTIGTSRRSATDLGEFTKNLALVAVHDTGYDWSALAVDTTPSLPLLDFPNTQLAERPLWAAYERVEEPVDAIPQRLRENWIRLAKRKLVAPRRIAVLDATGRSAELADALAGAAARHGAAVVEEGADTLVVFAGAPDDASNLALADFLAASWLPESGDVWLVTTGGERVLDADVPSGFGAAAAAGFRCLAIERPGVAFRHLDLQAGQSLAADAKAVVGTVHVAAEPELAVRDGGLYAKRLVVDDAVEPLGPDALGEVVIVGGTGKLGLDVAEQLARAGARRITLVSRSGGSPERVDRVRSAVDAEIVVARADVCDPEAVRALAATLGSVDLLVHAAVDYDAVALDPTPETLALASAPKVEALLGLVEALPLAPTGRVVVCSSLSATIGGRGHRVYAAVNRMLDAAADRLRAEGIAASSVQWGLWRAVGADQAEALAKISGTGLRPMDPAAAVAAGFAADAANCLVVSADWNRVAEMFDMFGMAPLFADLVVPEAVVTPEPVAPVAAPTPEAAPVVADTAETLRLALRAVMGLSRSETIDGSVPLVALGLDSLQALDLRKRVETELERDLPVTAILGGASLDEVVTLLGR